MTLYSPRQSLVTKLAIFTIWASKHGGQLLNEIFIYLKEITPSPTEIFERMENFQNDCCHPSDQKSFQEPVFKTFKNRKRSGCVDGHQVRSTNNCLCFLFFVLIFQSVILQSLIFTSENSTKTIIRLQQIIVNYYMACV